MASVSITFTFPQNAFGQREHGQPLRKLKWIRRETGAKFIIDLKKVDADGNLTCEWTGINDQCIQARKLMVAAVRKYNAWKRHQPVTASAGEFAKTEKVRPAATLHRVANVAPALQNSWNKIRKSPPALTGINTKRDRSPTPDMNGLVWPTLPSPGPVPMPVPLMTAAPTNSFGSYEDPYANIPDDMTDEDYKNMENYLDDFTAEGWRDEDCVQGEIAEQLLEAEIAGTECDPAPNSPFKVACYYPEESMYDEKGNLISLYHNYSRRVSWSPELVRKPMAGAY